MERKRQREGEGEGDMEEEDQRGNRAVTIRPGRRVSQALCVPLQGSWSPNPRNEPCRSPTLCPQQDTPSSLAPPSPPPLLLGKIPHTPPPAPPPPLTASRCPRATEKPMARGPEPPRSRRLRSVVASTHSTSCRVPMISMPRPWPEFTPGASCRGEGRRAQ